MKEEPSDYAMKRVMSAEASLSIMLFTKQKFFGMPKVGYLVQTPQL